MMQQILWQIGMKYSHISGTKNDATDFLAKRHGMMYSHISGTKNDATDFVAKRHGI